MTCVANLPSRFTNAKDKVVVLVVIKERSERADRM